MGQVVNLRADWQSARAGKARPSLPAQKKLLSKLAELAAACRTLFKDVDLVTKLSARVVDTAEKDAVDQLKLTAYFERQADWLLSRFPDAEFAAVPGLCRAVSLAGIEEADWSLTPGRYVGVAPAEVDEDLPEHRSANVASRRQSTSLLIRTSRTEWNSISKQNSFSSPSNQSHKGRDGRHPPLRLLL